MRKLIHVTSFDLACDAPGCGHVIKGVVPAPHWIGHKCQECGADMLSEADYQAMLRMLRTFAWINKWFGWLGTEERDVANTVARVMVNPTVNRLRIDVYPDGRR